MGAQNIMNLFYDYVEESYLPLVHFSLRPSSQSVFSAQMLSLLNDFREMPSANLTRTEPVLYEAFCFFPYSLQVNARI
jgi:hypothetical protein